MDANREASRATGAPATVKSTPFDVDQVTPAGHRQRHLRSGAPPAGAHACNTCDRLPLRRQFYAEGETWVGLYGLRMVREMGPRAWQPISKKKKPESLAESCRLAHGKASEPKPPRHQVQAAKLNRNPITNYFGKRPRDEGLLPEE